MRVSHFNVKVTQEDIDKAERNDSRCCAVAEAIKRTVPEATNVEVDIAAVRFTYRGERLIYVTTRPVQEYVVQFDAGAEIKPFGFRLSEPKRVQRRIMSAEARVVQRERMKRQRAKAAGKPVSTEPLPKVKGPVFVSDKGGALPPPRQFKKMVRDFGRVMLAENRWRKKLGQPLV